MPVHLCACFVGGDPTAPVYAGEIQAPALGMASDVAAEDGASLRDSPGTPGELVCRAPFPSMPLGFWNDSDGARYHAAYYERFPETWAHGASPRARIWKTSRSWSRLRPTVWPARMKARRPTAASS